MMTAFTNEHFTASSTGVYTVDHEKATPEITHMIVRIMYEGWIAYLMDKHAAEIFVVADFLGCPRIVIMACESLKRFDCFMFIFQIL